MPSNHLHQKTYRHIIRSLGIVDIQPLALLRLRHNPVQTCTHIRPNILIVVLVQAQCAGCVLDEQVQKPSFVVFNLWKLFQDRVGYEVGTARAGGESELLLEPV